MVNAFFGSRKCGWTFKTAQLACEHIKNMWQHTWSTTILTRLHIANGVRSSINDEHYLKIVSWLTDRFDLKQ